MIGIIDYGMGNMFSVFHALEMAGAEAKICANPVELNDMERIVLPGVGAFRDCMANLSAAGFIDELARAVFQEHKPILGICLGMQALARRSFEGGEHRGLGWIEADVVPIAPADRELRVPHIGWNEISYREGSPLFTGLPLKPDVYFVHSYHMVCDDNAIVEATCDYGGVVTSAIRKGNIFATQFHPEKSQDYGLKILENFINWSP